MPTYLAPGIYVEEVSSGNKPIAGVSTSTAAFVGVAEKGPVGRATLVTSFGEFVKRFGGPLRVIEGQQEHYLYYAVRHFFVMGGTICYVVRATDGSATAADADFDGRDEAGAVAAALNVAAINPGLWGEGLKVQVRANTRYSVRLSESIAGGPTAPFRVVQNDDIRVGSLLWIVSEASGVVQSLSTTNPLDVTFEDDSFLYDLAVPPDNTFSIVGSMRAFTPDLLLDTTTDAALAAVAVAVAGGPGGTAAGAVRLTTVTNANGETLRQGDTLNFAITEAMGVVRKVSEAVVGTETVMQVELEAGATIPAAGFDVLNSRVYERSFSVLVQNAGGDVVENHEGLSLVDTDPVNHVSVRLPAEEGLSFYVTASEPPPGGEAVLMNNSSFVPLTGGADGIPAMSDPLFEVLFTGDPVAGTGLHALDKITDASILCVTHASAGVAGAAIAYCEGRKDMFLVLETPRTTIDTAAAVGYAAGLTATTYAGFYYPWIQIVDPFSGRKVGIPPSGAVCGIFAGSDGKRGVHKAPAGYGVGLVTVAAGTAAILSKADNDKLHPAKVNAIRNTTKGIVVWGARTLSADAEWVYTNVRRLFIFLEQSIEQGTQWVAFEPNDSSLWKSLIRNISAFLRIQWNAGMLVGATQEEAFYVKCDSETNPPEIVDAGMVVTEIGVAPSKPAEFVVFRIQQIAGGDTSS